MPDDILIITNPISGGGRGRSVAERAARYIAAHGGRARVILTQAPGDGARLARDALRDTLRRIAACGGDGTVHEVAGALTGSDATLGILPCGRGNDFARALGIPTHPERAAAVLLDGTPRRVDLGQVNGQPFCTVVTLGFDSEVARLVYDKAVPFSGTAAYVYGVFKTLARYRGLSLRLHGDFGALDGPVLLAATGNTTSYGGGMRIVPQAVPDDGLLDVCHVRMLPPLGILRLFPTVFWGGHVTHPAVTITRTRRLSIETDAPAWLFADGEPICQTPAEISLVERALTVLCGRPAD